MSDNEKTTVEIRAVLNRVRTQLQGYDFVRSVAFGASSRGFHYFPVVKIDMEHRAAELPTELEGVFIEPRFEKDA